VPAPHGFEYEVRDEEVAIFHHGRRATVLRGRRASEFLVEVERGDPQQLMARLAGNYKRGNERQGKFAQRRRREP
jgi:hypothetical protein